LDQEHLTELGLVEAEESAAEGEQFVPEEEEIMLEEEERMSVAKESMSPEAPCEEEATLSVREEGHSAMGEEEFEEEHQTRVLLPLAELREMSIWSQVVIVWVCQ
jgi:hypothetical protein